MKRNRPKYTACVLPLIGVVALLLSAGCAAWPAATPVPLPEPFFAQEPVPMPTPPLPGVGAAQEEWVAEDRMFVSDSTKRLVVRTAGLNLVVSDTDRALAEIQSLAEELGGYIVSVEAYQYQEGRQATVTFRVPADELDTALERLRQMATTVQGESVSGQDVTDEYVDLQSRLRHLEAKEKQLLKFLEEAESTEDVLAVYQHLSQTQAEIEQVKGRMQYLENQVALATITVNLIPDALAQPLDTGGWNLPATFRNAIEALLNVLEFLVKALIYIVIVILPTLIFLATPVVGLFLLIRWRVRRRR